MDPKDVWVHCPSSPLSGGGPGARIESSSVREPLVREDLRAGMGESQGDLEVRNEIPRREGDPATLLNMGLFESDGDQNYIFGGETFTNKN